MQDPSFKDQTNIVKSDVQKRALDICSVAYELTVSIPQGEQFHGHQIISFDLQQALKGALEIDCHIEKIHSITVNQT